MLLSVLASMVAADEVDDLISSLKDEDSEVRWRAAFMLGKSVTNEP